MERRGFLRICAAAAAAAPMGAAEAKDLRPRMYTRTRLMEDARQPLRASQLAVGRNYIFHYPFEGTPCFLINLGKPAGRKVTLNTGDGALYEWPGGVGPQRAIVEYSAICSHKLTYPTRQISFISYRDRSSASAVSRAETIHCCSEHSEYDPASGARVLNGPAPQPLSAILLEHDPTSDALYALGTLGGELFDTFFAKSELAAFCKQQVRC